MVIINTLTIAEEITLDVTARIVENLTITTNDVNFGKIVRGKEKREPDVPGMIYIDGESNSIVSLELQGNGEEMKNILNLYYKGIKNEENKIAYKAKFFRKNGEEVLLNSNGKLTLNLSDEGSEEINLKGSIQTDKNIELGNYEGVISIRVKYLR
ncbi:hypothetical protein [Fusobacterium mortiferum]|uniref:Lipocalin-like domain-containing protein n=1 Tax=Fusobacterium mortiferum ATCC 9817 TaxID=469616 RepID=A0ABM6TUG4_FUSMR|nr:hypothetical protein [Fusobacterium mortiferum]AVQ17723.1 hypothetical protein C4N19_00680 [Fusobacterium mortiferum ATCC 9817]MCF2699912.1 hypothetical protein [Fusobacterium mortiferum]MDY2801944.1 hypothetical protein [Fusobacterium mortiferum]MDY4801294.1 hypothetical protein [Fusobacterium mortiferum]